MYIINDDSPFMWSLGSRGAATGGTRPPRGICTPTLKSRGGPPMYWSPPPLLPQHLFLLVGPPTYTPSFQRP